MILTIIALLHLNLFPPIVIHAITVMKFVHIVTKLFLYPLGEKLMSLLFLSKGRT